MDPNKFCFISCVKDNFEYEKNHRYHQFLTVPEGYEVEFKFLENGQSICSGYNIMMNQSNAKYKIYIHTDTYITNKNILFDLIKIFTENPTVGLIGLCGASTPVNGIWWESTKKFGKVIECRNTDCYRLLKFSEPENDFENVIAVDGLFMATQYDIPWRLELFDGWHFYDISQSLEFIKKGHKVAVPRQKSPWCIHDCGSNDNLETYHYYREIFLKEYSEEIADL